MSGWLKIAGLGPGADTLMTAEVSDALAQATDVIGYIPYVARVAERPGLTLHPSDNRVEIDRSRHALALAAEGRRVVVVSSGDPGVFAMAAAVFETLEAGPPGWRALDIAVLPGITAMLAAAARIGAPLGHDFCAINLSDNLKPWGTDRDAACGLAAEADFAMAFYNPRSKLRPEGFEKALDLLKRVCGRPAPRDLRPCRFHPRGRHPRRAAARRPGRRMADMRTVVLLGNSATRQVPRPGGAWVYTPRSAGMMRKPAHHLLHRMASGARRQAGRSIMITGRPSGAGRRDLGRAPVPPAFLRTTRSMP